MEYKVIENALLFFWSEYERQRGREQEQNNYDDSRTVVHGEP